MTELGGKNWDLSLYELHRTPQEAITDSQQITISPKVWRRTVHPVMHVPYVLTFTGSSV